MGMCPSREEKDRHADAVNQKMNEDSPLKFGKGAGGDTATASGNLFGARTSLSTKSFINAENLRQRRTMHKKGGRTK